MPEFTFSKADVLWFTKVKSLLCFKIPVLNISDWYTGKNSTFFVTSLTNIVHIGFSPQSLPYRSSSRINLKLWCGQFSSGLNCKRAWFKISMRVKSVILLSNCVDFERSACIKNVNRILTVFSDLRGSQTLNGIETSKILPRDSVTNPIYNKTSACEVKSNNSKISYLIGSSLNQAVKSPCQF